MLVEEQKTHNQVLDVLRFISILAVVLIHTTTRTIEMTGNDLQHIPWTLFLNQASRFAVPLFFMISGFVLELNYSFATSYGAYLKKRIKRILIPYIFWSFIYYFFVYKQHQVNFFSTLLTGSASYQLYFIPTLLVFYIIFPLLHKLYRIIANKWVMFFLGTLQIALLYYSYYIKPLPFFYPISIALLNYFIFFLGMFASHHEEDLVSVVKRWKYMLTPITIFLVGYIFWEGKSLYLKTHNYLFFYSQWRPSIFFYTILLASSLYLLFYQKKLPPFLIGTLARLSFFVFFVHVIVLETIWKTVGISVFQQTGGNIIEHLWYDPLFFALTAFFSFFIAYLASKIPFLDKLTG